MLDPVEKIKSTVQPVQFEEIKVEGKEKKKGKNLDFTFLKKSISLKAKYHPCRPRKIYISKNSLSIKRKRFYWGFAMVGISIIILILFFSSSLFGFIKLFYSIKNQKVLIGFQNSAELRPTGGFWGSFAFLNVGSNITDSSLYFETNPYKKDNPLLKETNVELPKPLKEVFPDRPQSFVNANWSIDFPQAAKTIEWYFGEGWKENSDAVIGVSSLTMIDLLKIIGPIQAKDGTTISSENFSQVMSEKIETEYWNNPDNLKINEPKTIILDLAPQVIEKTKKLPRLTILSFILKQFEKGRIIAYFNNEGQEKLAKDLGLSGETLPYRIDYLSVNNANLGGNKSSLNVKQSVDYSVTNNNGRSESEVKITRSVATDAWPNVQNKNYTRVIAPLGSKLVWGKLSNIDITNQIETTSEMGKTTFGFWFNVDPGESQSAQINYQTPISSDQLNNYQLVYQKQPGTIDENLNINILGHKLYEGQISRSSLTLH